ncbi:MAG: hypothetical protein ABW220_05650 [Burkholderiaceae bacterium]
MIGEIAAKLAPEILGALSGGGGATSAGSSIQPQQAAGGALGGVINLASSLLGNLFGQK